MELWLGLLSHPHSQPDKISVRQTGDLPTPSSNLQLSRRPWCSAISFLLPGGFRNFHPLEHALGECIKQAISKNQNGCRLSCPILHNRCRKSFFFILSYRHLRNAGFVVLLLLSFHILYIIAQEQVKIDSFFRKTMKMKNSFFALY